MPGGLRRTTRGMLVSRKDFDTRDEHLFTFAALKTATGSAAGTSLGRSRAVGNLVTLNAFSFFPMLHQDAVQDEIGLEGHDVQGGPDDPRFCMGGHSGDQAHDWDVDWRYIETT